MKKIKREIVVNEIKCKMSALPSERLLDVLRDNGQIIVKEGCGEGICGACSIIHNDKLINSCLTLFGQIKDNDNIKTAMLDDKLINILKESFEEAAAVQCGFCTPGMLMASYTLLSSNKSPSDNDIKEAIAGNLCRCTGYVKIIDAVKLASEKL